MTERSATGREEGEKSALSSTAPQETQTAHRLVPSALDPTAPCAGPAIGDGVRARGYRTSDITSDITDTLNGTEIRLRWVRGFNGCALLSECFRGDCVAVRRAADAPSLNLEVRFLAMALFVQGSLKHSPLP